MATQPDGKNSGNRDARVADRRHVFRRAADKRNAAVWALGEWVLQRQQQPYFLVDQQLTLMFHNRAAQRALGRLKWLLLDDQRVLVIRDADLSEKVRDTLARWPHAAAAATSLQLVAEKRTIDVTRLPIGQAQSAMYAIALPASNGMTIGHEQLRKAFGLTKVQAQIALLIYEGGNRVSAGKRLGKSVNTVKSHMRAVFQKVGVRSQRELIRRVGELVPGG